MPIPKPKKNILQFGLNETSAKKILKNLADHRIFFTNHVEERMVERSITRKQVFKCIKHGKIIEGPYQEPNGDWKLKLEVITAGDVVRTVAVLQKDERGDYCLIITVF